MTTTKNAASTRRRFLQGGALLAAPLAAASVSAVLAAAPPSDRLRYLEDESALRALHGEWLRQVTSGGAGTLLPVAVRGIIPDHAGTPERLEIDAAGASATRAFDGAVEFETPLSTDWTLGHMAHLQGHGVVRHVERRTVIVRYLRRATGWQIAGVELAPSAAFSL